jgi:hypothetical protein
MRRRVLLVTVAVVIAVTSQVPAKTSAQSPAGAANKAAAPSKPAPAAGARTLRTPWGEPNLQGIWNDQYQIPLQRPAQYEGREFLTDAEIADIDRKRESLERREHRAGAKTEQDVAGAYNAVFESHRKTGRRTSLVVDPPDGRIPAMTPAATKRLEIERAYQANPRTAANPGTWNTGRMNRADGPEDRSTAERCLGSMLPDLNAFIRIVQAPGSVAIYYEHGQGGGGTRIIPTNNSPHLPANIRQWYGDARGHWEGDTLVVDTTNFGRKTFYRAAHENLHLIERFRRTDANTLAYEVRVEDATTWTRPWTVRVELQKNDDRFNRIFESTCHEGNYGLTGMLANTRAAERLFAEGKGPDPATMNLALGGAGGEADPFEGGAE